jgi:UTP-glucose-1-phosphate uridylyltransferase
MHKKRWLMDAIIPAAGLATRMKGIPKFLLPCDTEYLTLIERHIQNLTDTCETIWIPTRPELVGLLDSLGLSRDKLVILPVRTENMTQTVSRVMKLSSAETFQLVMPDTYFHGEMPYKMSLEPNSLVNLACWRIRPEQLGKLGQVEIDQNSLVTDMKDKDPNCTYDHSWGSLIFRKELHKFIDLSEPHIGYAVRNALISGEVINAKRVKGRYFDCGTPSEYISLLSEVLL